MLLDNCGARVRSCWESQGFKSRSSLKKCLIFLRKSFLVTGASIQLKHIHHPSIGMAKFIYNPCGRLHYWQSRVQILVTKAYRSPSARTGAPLKLTGRKKQHQPCAQVERFIPRVKFVDLISSLVENLTLRRAVNKIWTHLR